jgi:hypothetical protein
MIPKLVHPYYNINKATSGASTDFFKKIIIEQLQETL